MCAGRHGRRQDPCGRVLRRGLLQERPGKDKKIGSTRSRKSTGTKNFYPFSYSEPGVARLGEYYAKVKPTDTCKGARSAVMSGPG
jgi:hypothetical protein